MTLPSNPCMSDMTAAKMTRLLIGCYAREPHDAEVYVAMLTKLFAEYPEEIGREAVDRVSRSNNYLPNRAEVAQVLEQVRLERRPKPGRSDVYAEVAASRQEQEAKLAARKADRERLEAILGDSSADWWSIPVMRRYGGQPSEFRSKWYATEGDPEARQRLLMTWGQF